MINFSFSAWRRLQTQQFRVENYVKGKPRQFFHLYKKQKFKNRTFELLIPF